MEDIKTIDVQAKQWFDKVYGNSYFSARVTVNYGLPGEFEIRVPYEYGYGNYYEYAALKALQDIGLLSGITALWQIKEKGIILRSSKQEGCLKRAVVQWGQV